MFRGTGGVFESEYESAVYDSFLKNFDLTDQDCEIVLLVGRQFFAGERVNHFDGIVVGGFVVDWPEQEDICKTSVGFWEALGESFGNRFQGS
ncbi:hypothetical protein [Ereboglobus sp. PH5-10]|uniref:hypothetical protein n=1 Tax=Ereboglobus sp. PH5-10 TaxID=2940629 RepID=UPI0024050B55|nr:hypothetical protein [Ereboglobus sp. PH5-10]